MGVTDGLVGVTVMRLGVTWISGCDGYETQWV